MKLLVILLFICVSTKSQNKIIISYEKLGRDIQLYYVDEFDNSQPPFTLTKGESKIIDSESPLFLTQPNFNQNQFLVFPNEELKIHEKGGKIYFNSRNRVRINELNFFGKLIDSLKSYKINSNSSNWNDSISIEKNFINLEVTYNKLISYLEYYSEKNIISDFFKHTIKSYFFYALVTSQMPVYNKGFYLANYSSKQIKQINSVLPYFNSDSSLFIPTYRSAVLSYIMLINNAKSLTFDTDYNSLLRSCDEILSNKTKDFAKYFFLKRAIRYRVTLNIIDLINELQDPIYRSILLDAYDNTVLSASVGNKILLIDSYDKSISFDEIVNSQRQKLILFDFWASWCIPCIKEFPKSLLLQKNVKNLTVVYVSLDDEKYKWKSSLSTNKINIENSFLLINGFESMLAKKFKLTTIPRYILIGKDGKVISADAPRPSDPKLKALIDKYINL